MHAGSLALQVRDAAQDADIAVLVLYPTEWPSAPTSFGPYLLDVAPDAPVAPGRHPLVVLSHGNGGSHLLYRAICVHLAQHGYVVAMFDHPGNNRNDDALANTDANLANRPRHVRLVTDAVMAAMPVHGDRLAIVGHSLGGYTALAVAGGTPWYDEQRPVEVEPDPRVRALVLLTPATPWYAPPDSLRNVRVPVLMLTAEHDPWTPGWMAELVLERVPDRSKVTFREVANAGHFSFLGPFPSVLVKTGLPAAQDPPGFDRAAFQPELAIEVREFLDRTLKGGLDH
jgi:predicted dienelactone hydrolase